MPTNRQKAHHLTLSTGDKNIAVELFDARQWPEQSSDEGEFRVRIDRKWYSPAGKYTFLPLADVGKLIARLLSGAEIFEAQAPPVAFKTMARVSVQFGECADSIPLESAVGFIAAPPVRDTAGRWHVPVCIPGADTAYYPIHDVKALER